MTKRNGKKKSGDKSRGDDQVHPPAWLRELLDAARASAEFRTRCEEAGKLARNINRLREANSELAFQRNSLHQRVTALAKSANISLAPVLQWFGIRKLSLADSDDALARFSREIGFTESHFFDHLRIGEALAQGLPVPVAGRAFRKSLDDLPWDRETRSRFRALREALDAEYAKPED